MSPFLVAAAAALACGDAATAFPEKETEEGAETGATQDAAIPDGAVLPDGSAVDAGGDGAIKDKNLGNSAGCGKAGAGTGFQTRKITIAAKERTYLRFIPAGYDPQKPMPVVFGLHGSGGTAAGARASYDLEAAAAGKGIFIYPQALPYDPNFPGDNRWDADQGSSDYAFIDALIAEIEDSHCVARDRVFVAGFSNGARMSAMLGCFRGDKLRAIASVAPGGNAATLPLKGCVGEVGLWGGLGTEDAEHEPGVKIVRAYYTGINGCTQTTDPTMPKGCVSYQGCRAEVPVTWCSYPGGHAWPSIGGIGVWGFFDSFK